MKKHLNANVLLVSLILISSIISLIFLAKDKLISIEKLTQNSYQNYLQNRIKLIDLNRQDKNAACQNHQENYFNQKIDNLNYQYLCQMSSLFVVPKPTKEKYIQTENIKDWLDLETYQEHITYIDTLSDLPASSLDEPKIVIARNEIDERLTKDFYGIIITDSYFNFTGSKRIYGTLYSSFDNLREERKLVYKREVLENLERIYSKWTYLENSTNILGANSEE